MRLLIIYLLFSLGVLNAQDEQSVLQLITDSEAVKLVASQEKAKERQKADFKAFLKSAKAIEEHSYYKDGRRILHRRVEPPKEKRLTSANAEKNDAPEALNLADFTPEEYRSETLSFHVTNYDELYSEITWRDENKVFSVWTNVSLNHLPALNSFKLDDVHYSYFGFADDIDSTIEKERADSYLFHGQQYEYKSRWKEVPVAFGEEPEYVVIPEEEEVVIPEKLYEQMDAVLRFYLENEASLRISHLNSEKLNKTRTKYLRENPPQPEESVFIYSLSPSGE